MTPEQERKAAATLLLDMLHMRNGRHEGMDDKQVNRLWRSVMDDDGFPSVVSFLVAVERGNDTP